MMAPILDELKDENDGAIDIEFADVWQHPELAKEYAIESIPTQIFLDESGKELFRREGFFAKEEILAKRILAETPGRSRNTSATRTWRRPRR